MRRTAIHCEVQYSNNWPQLRHLETCW